MAIVLGGGNDLRDAYQPESSPREALSAKAGSGKNGQQYSRN
jgi:hypothetical protein